MQNPVLEYEGNDDNKKEPELSKTETLDKKEAEQSDIDLREKVREANTTTSATGSGNTPKTMTKRPSNSSSARKRPWRILFCCN